MQMAAMHQERRQLGVAGRAPQVHHHVLRDAGRQRLAALLGDQVQREVDPGGDAGAGRDRPIDHEHAVVDHLRIAAPGPAARQQFVVRGAAASGEQAGPRREQRARADREHAVRRIRGEERLAEPTRLSHSRGGGDRRRDLAELGGRLADQHHPGRRASAARATARGRPARARQRSAAVAVGPAKRSRKRGGRPARSAMQVGQAKRLRRPRDVEQQRVRRDDEQEVDQVRACDHFRTWSGGIQAYIQMRSRRNHRRNAAPMSETDPNLSARGARQSAADHP